LRNTELGRGYGRWQTVEPRAERRTFVLRGLPPQFFVSVASKGFNWSVSLLFAALAGRCISVAGKELREEEVGK
jgi:hypothetical protein